MRSCCCRRSHGKALAGIAVASLTDRLVCPNPRMRDESPLRARLRDLCCASRSSPFRCGACVAGFPEPASPVQSARSTHGRLPKLRPSPAHLNVPPASGHYVCRFREETQRTNPAMEKWANDAEVPVDDNPSETFTLPARNYTGPTVLDAECEQRRCRQTAAGRCCVCERRTSSSRPQTRSGGLGDLFLRIVEW